MPGQALSHGAWLLVHCRRYRRRTGRNTLGAASIIAPWRAQYRVCHCHYRGGALYVGAYFISVLTIEGPGGSDEFQSGATMKRSIDLAGAAQSRRQVLALLGAGAAILGVSRPASAQRAGGEPSEAAVLRDPDVPVVGNPDGDITIV